MTGGLPPMVDQPDLVYESLARELPNCHHVSMMISTDCLRSGDQTQYYLLRKYPLDVKRVIDLSLRPPIF